MLGPLADPEVFDQVSLDPEADTFVWPNGADFDPATLHDWPEEGRGWQPWPGSGGRSPHEVAVLHNLGLKANATQTADVVFRWQQLTD